MIYLDNAATTRILPCAMNDMAYVMRNDYGNPNSSHDVGQTARDIMERSRVRIAECINAEPEQIVFTSGATEACHLAMRAMTANCGVTQVSAVEHHAVLDYPVFTNRMPRDGLVQMLANNETGEQFTIPRRKHSTDWIFTDATAAIGHIPIDVKKLHVNFLAAGAHKFGGPCGVGFLFDRDCITERNGGTPPVALIAGMAAALEWHVEHMEENIAKLEDMKLKLEQIIHEFSYDKNFTYKVNSPDYDKALPHIINISFDGVDGKTLALMCSKRGVMVSAGAACTSGDNAPSHVLMAMYGDEARARSAIRISLSHENTIGECEHAAQIIAECVQQLRELN